MEDRIVAMLDDSINEIFLKLQEEIGNEDGGVGFDTEYDIAKLTEKRATVIARAVKEQKGA